MTSTTNSTTTCNARTSRHDDNYLHQCGSMAVHRLACSCVAGLHAAAILTMGKRSLLWTNGRTPGMPTRIWDDGGGVRRPSHSNERPTKCDDKDVFFYSQCYTTGVQINNKYNVQLRGIVRFNLAATDVTMRTNCDDQDANCGTK